MSTKEQPTTSKANGHEVHGDYWEGFSWAQNQILELLDSLLKKSERTPWTASPLRTVSLQSREPRITQSLPTMRATAVSLGNYVSFREQPHSPLILISTEQSGYTFFSGRPEVLFQGPHFSPPPTKKIHQRIIFPFFCSWFPPFHLLPQNL